MSCQCHQNEFGFSVCNECIDDTKIKLTKMRLNKLENQLKEHEEQKSEGVKHDSGKPKLSLLTPESLAYESRAFEYGAKKYGKDNYKKGMEWSRVADAALRHLTAWTNKQDNDPESGLNHICHAKACLAMLAYYIENNKGKDDR